MEMLQIGKQIWNGDSTQKCEWEFVILELVSILE